ncbi:MAG: hypothetical protein L0220_33930 [Acidobacteria bacterium]|nr:hypothetical protein [Acidobacteriota bacterium]
MKSARRRSRRFDSLATPDGVRRVCEQLRERLPDYIPKSDRKLFSMLNAVRHVNRYSATDTGKGRPANWERDLLLEVSRHLGAILERETGGRVSISTFVGLYLRVLHFPVDVSSALGRGEINLQEAMLLSRLNHNKLRTDSNTARAIRRHVIDAHLESNSSQNQLRVRVREMLGESGIVSGETLAVGIQKADSLLEVDPEDLRHLFFETMKELFFALREFNPEDLDETDIDEIMVPADLLAGAIHSIKQRIKARTQPKKAIEGFGVEKEPEQGQRPIVETNAKGHTIYRFPK